MTSEGGALYTLAIATAHFQGVPRDRLDDFAKELGDREPDDYNAYLDLIEKYREHK